MGAMSAPANLYDTLALGFADRLDAPAIVVPDGCTCTYGDVEARTAQVADRLASLGVKAGDRVAAQIDKSVEGLLAYLGTLRAGAVFLPLNPAYKADEVGYFLGDAEPVLAIGRPDTPWFDDAARAAGVGTVLHLDGEGRGTWADAVATASSAAPTGPRPDADDMAVIVYTSGTTGRSKGAMIGHGNLTSNARALQQLWEFRRDDVLLHALPIFHVHGLFVATHTAMLTGIPMRFHTAFDAAGVAADLPNATVFMGVPTMYTRLLGQAPLTKERCAGMRLFVSGSAPLLPETFHDFSARTGHVILERYGMTETGMNTSNPATGERRAGTVGLPLPGVSVRVVADGDAPVAVGSIGDVQVKGPNVFAGYWRRPDKNAEEFTADGWFRTGDVGQFDADGYLELVGRSKDLIISGGYNVYPKEVELLLDALPGVVESAVVGLPHPDFGEAVTAAVTLQPGAAFDADAVIAKLKAELASFKVPKTIVVVDELPRNAMGKVQKNVLRDHLKG